ncbi:MAG: hypothetical protein ONB07_08095 [candidate division KSB1 bacterium]|nr:hypothetical protein [candidate division KSB1 bacterium]MDZ7391333.1 hypothetical protein [candidate division KSB1 bacterium]
MGLRSMLPKGAIVLLAVAAGSTLNWGARSTAGNVEGYTYYWDAYKQRWLAASGATVTAYHQGQQCGQTVSDHKGWYNVCVTICCQQGPLVRVEATYQGMSDYFETEDACDRVLRHDFYMDGWHKIAPPGH